MSPPPTISIVMPCYNAAPHLPRSVASVRAQSVTDWELIVVDDGSTDSSAKVLRALAAEDVRIRAVSQLNAGAAVARNRGLEHVRGRYTAFLDADDTWHPDFLAEMVGALESHTDAGLAYCGWQNIGLGGGRDDPYVPPDYEAGDKTATLLRSCPWPIHGALTRSELVRQAGGFDEAFRSCMDYDLWLRLGTAHRLLRVERVLAYYHHHGGTQITASRARLALNHRRVQAKFLNANPGALATLGRARVRALTAGELLRRGYVAYWRRDMATARTIFRAVMREGYGGWKDWLYMLPSWLPENWHRRLLAGRDRGPAAPDRPSHLP